MGFLCIRINNFTIKQFIPRIRNLINEIKGIRINEIKKKFILLIKKSLWRLIIKYS